MFSEECSTRFNRWVYVREMGYRESGSNQELAILSPVNIHVNTALGWMHVLG